jgi:cytochrome b6-f complex iron-sulfur subunit
MPTDPSMKKTPSGKSSRRSFLTRLWKGLGIVAALQLVWVFLNLFQSKKSRKIKEALGNIVEAGPVESFEPNTVKAFRKDRFYLARLEDGGFLALSRQCTHLGCVVPWDTEKKQFVCPCHRSSFDLAGNVLSAPAPRALDFFKVTIKNNIVYVDTADAVKRQSFDPGQVVYLS